MWSVKFSPIQHFIVIQTIKFNMRKCRVKQHWRNYHLNTNNGKFSLTDLLKHPDRNFKLPYQQKLFQHFPTLLDNWLKIKLCFYSILILKIPPSINFLSVFTLKQSSTFQCQSKYRSNYNDKYGRISSLRTSDYKSVLSIIIDNNCGMSPLWSFYLSCEK